MTWWDLQIELCSSRAFTIMGGHYGELAGAAHAAQHQMGRMVWHITALKCLRQVWDKIGFPTHSPDLIMLASFHQLLGVKCSEKVPMRWLLCIYNDKRASGKRHDLSHRELNIHPLAMCVALVCRTAKKEQCTECSLEMEQNRQIDFERVWDHCPCRHQVVCCWCADRML